MLGGVVGGRRYVYPNQRVLFLVAALLVMYVQQRRCTGCAGDRARPAAGTRPPAPGSLPIGIAAYRGYLTFRTR
jgi:hypothetical protein